MKRFWRCAIPLILLLFVIGFVSAQASTEYLGYDDAVAQLRQQLVNRQTTAVVYLSSDSEIGTLDLMDMLEDAMAHTGNPIYLHKLPASALRAPDDTVMARDALTEDDLIRLYDGEGFFALGKIASSPDGTVAKSEKLFRL